MMEVSPKLSVSRYRIWIVLTVCSFSLLGCNKSEKIDKTSIKGQSLVKRKLNPAEINEMRKQWKLTFHQLGPIGWSLIESRNQYYGQSARYYVNIDIPIHGISSKLMFGTITLNQEIKEDSKTRYYFSRDMKKIPEPVSETALKYPDITGYYKSIDNNRIGYSIKHNKDIHRIVYWSQIDRVICSGVSPGEMACFWRNKYKSFNLVFQSEYVSEVLPYVLSLAKEKSITPN